MSKLVKWLIVAVSATVLAGCVIVPRGYYHHDRYDRYDRYDDRDHDRGRRR